MFTIDYRPKRLSDLAGQESAKKVIKAIIDNPDNSPQNIILYGKYGTGKSSLAKIFARTLNCSNGAVYDACLSNSCNICNKDLDKNNAFYYTEYNSARYSSKNDMVQIANQLNYLQNKGWMINNFEEFHLVSKDAQSVLLEELEKDLGKVFNVFCTTEIDDILDTIRSRCLEVQFYPVKSNFIVTSLKDICQKENIQFKDSTIELLAERAGGSVRDAHMELDRIKMIGEKDYLDSIVDTTSFYLDFINAAIEKDSKEAYSVLEKLINEKLEVLKKSFYNTILEINEVKYNISNDKRQGKVDKIVNDLDDNLINLIKLSLEDWVSSSFKSDYEFKNAMMGLYQIIEDNF